MENYKQNKPVSSSHLQINTNNKHSGISADQLRKEYSSKTPQVFRKTDKS